MADVNKTVFISYRRSGGSAWAQLVRQDLHAHGYDVFLDVRDIPSGPFDETILQEIAARDHFVLILSPGCLDRCKEPDDWLRREIEEALRLDRNVVPVLVDGFDIGEARDCLTGKLEGLDRQNGLELQHASLDATLDRLRNVFLRKVVPRAPDSAIRPADEDGAWVREVLNWLHSGSVSRYGSCGGEWADLIRFTEWEQHASTLDDSLLYREGRTLVEQRTYLKAAAYWAELAKRVPRNAEYESYFRLCLSKVRRQFKIHEAIEALMSKAQSMRAMRYLEVVISMMNQVLALCPNYPDALRMLYEAENAQADKQAIEDWTKVIRLNPDDADAYNNRGNAYWKMRTTYAWYDTEKIRASALADYKEAIRLKPDFAEAYYNRGIAYADMREYEKAIMDLTEAIRLKPDFERAYFERGEAYAEVNRCDEAVADYTEAIRLKPERDGVYYQRGQAYAKMNRYDEAVADYTEAIWLEPDSGWLYYQRGRAYAKMNGYDGAVADYIDALRLVPRSSYSYLYDDLQEALLRLGLAKKGASREELMRLGREVAERVKRK